MSGQLVVPGDLKKLALWNGKSCVWWKIMGRAQRRLDWKTYCKFNPSGPAYIDAKPGDPNEVLQFATFVYQEQAILVSSWQVDDERFLDVLKQKYPTKSFTITSDAPFVMDTPLGPWTLYKKIASVH